MLMFDAFNNDAFSAITLTAAINNIDHVPGRAGELAFVGVGEGVATTTVTFEQQNEVLSLLPSRPRGAPSTYETASKRKVSAVQIPHIPLDDVIRADEIQNVRTFGGEFSLQSVIQVVNQRLTKAVARHDLTLENLRLGALRGQILDADGSVLADLYSLFNVTPEPAVSFELDVKTTDVRAKCHEVYRKMQRNAKMAVPSSGTVHAFCGDAFFDALLQHPSVKGVYDGHAAAERRLGDRYAFGVFEFGGIFFENYRGTDDGTTVSVATNEARFFWTGVPGMYIERYAPADFIEAANTIGLPRYAKQEPLKLNRGIHLHTQQNPLPVCLRPKTLMTATIT